jgi:hypothetical protein
MDSNKINSKEYKKIANPHTKIPIKPMPKREGHARDASNSMVLQNQVYFEYLFNNLKNRINLTKKKT